MPHSVHLLKMHVNDGEVNAGRVVFRPGVKLVVWDRRTHSYMLLLFSGCVVLAAARCIFPSAKHDLSMVVS